MDHRDWNLLHRARRIVAARFAATWNWALGHAALACLGLALLFRSGQMAATGLILLAASLFTLHLPPCRHTRLLRAQAAQQAWLNAPWTRRKRLQAVWLGLGLAALLAVLWSGSLALLTLAVGGAALWLAHRSTQRRLKDMARDEALDRLMEQERKERKERGDRP